MFLRRAVAQIRRLPVPQSKIDQRHCREAATSNHGYAEQLEDAADAVDFISPADLQALLRRAALRLRNTAQLQLDPEWEDALQCVAAAVDFGWNELIRMMVQKWVKAQEYAGGRHRN
ncbi:hypothetical protein [Pseudaminobacter sp. NGMCC 1.201702]|uniref:hypothetical protein n=1 Tax=Pseudaminobacter sp. NGMCC 1.201702 TaxID=3391825 RepID=UPI0039EE0273